MISRKTQAIPARLGPPPPQRRWATHPPAPACSPECIVELDDPRGRHSTSPNCPGRHEPNRTMINLGLEQTGIRGYTAPMLPVDGPRTPGVPG